MLLTLQLPKLDQKNLKLKIKEWKVFSVFQSFLRAYIKKSDMLDSQDRPKSNNSESTTSCDDDPGDCSQTFLWMHQEKWQQDLLVKYGNTITLIDTTYKTTKYKVALFFLCVKTNVGYVVVAEFVVSSESAEEIGEAISFLKKWNPNQNPAYFLRCRVSCGQKNLSFYPGKHF